MHQCLDVSALVMEDAWMALASPETNGLQMSGKGLLPALRGVPRAIKTQFEFAQHFPVHLNLLRQLDIHIPLDLRVEVCPAHVIDHNAAPSSPLGMCSRMANHGSQCLQWRYGGIQGIVTPYVGFPAYQSRIDN